VAEPFLSSGSGFDEAVAALDALYPAPIDGRALLLMGHGSEHPANGLYSMLEAKLADLGPGRFVANVEGYPGIERAIKRLRSRGIASVDIAPLMLVAGVHVYEDMVGDDEGSWINLLGRAGIEARPILHGLGEDEAVRRVFASRLKATLTRLREDTPAIGHGVGASTP
jgi:sirohydrochlorin cobaltochelatase